MKVLKQINKNTIKINNSYYKGYLLGDLPLIFGFKSKLHYNEEGEVEEAKGLNKWFNYKGLTYLLLRRKKY